MPRPSPEHVVLIVDDEAPFRRMMENVVDGAGFGVVTAASGEEALTAIEERRPGLVLLDLRLGAGAMDGIAALEQIRAKDQQLPVVMITGFGNVGHAVAAMKLGALDFLEKPVDLDEVRRILHNVFDPDGDSETDDSHRAIEFGGIVPAPGPLRATVELMSAAADSLAPLLISGESGTGKELAASFIHEHSPCATGPYIKVNCAAISPNLLEAEMFGVVKGAFTGANQDKPGRFEAADGGSLLLDEIGELEPSLQAKLLRALQEKEIERVGSIEPRKVCVRLIASTNRDLQKAMTEGRFREDLFFRLNVFEIVLPPLRERPDDILPLAQLFAAELAPDKPRRLAPETEKALGAYDWPGNVRELRNAIERAVILARGGVIRPTHLPPNIGDTPPRESPAATTATFGRGSIHEMERKLIIETLQRTEGNRTQAAEALGISRRALQYKLKRYSLP